MNIDNYPQFKPLDIKDKPLFDMAFKNCPPRISEFTFTNLYSWRHVYKFGIFNLGGLIILRSDETTPPRFFDPIGKGDIKSAVSKILDDSGGSFIRLPKETKSLFDEDDKFKIEPDPNNSDYLFKMEDLINLPGKKYDGKKNLIRKFKSAYNYEYVTLNASNAGSVLEFEDVWCSIRDCDNLTGLYNERDVIKEIVANFANFKLTGGAIKVEGMIRAVAIGERLNKDTLVMHIFKADPNIAGLYQVMMNEFLSREGSAFKFVNLEQDLGVDGLRKSKLSYHPVEMINKYTITKWKR